MTHFKAAPATFVIAGVTAIISLIVTLFGFEPQATLYAGFIPGRASLVLAGDVPGLAPVVLTPLTATLVHGGPLHLLFNLVTLVYCGIATERALGSRGVVVLYLLGAYAACVAQWVVGPQSPVPMIGASGAASAIVGAYALLYGRQKTQDVGPVPGWLIHVGWLLVAWSLLNLAIGVLSAQTGMPIAAAAHIGGFVLGLALCRPLLLWNWRGA
ncbi:protease [Sphingomonas sp. Leaf33]|uniref:rhomboid family intramembrane serine protease n=1 Tax=Sphingomonas sp. Leaf33 TaxID=1736215 RepID=UPI0006FC7F1B|nr:rhomboid family intramembrane serine protease [Sphingomonas sp. Leaf33]KQN26155.1 protease [Sphingomonas sp. Leaf33]